MEVAEKGGYVRKPKVGWYEAVDPATGEILSDKLLRAKEIVDNPEFWDKIFKQTDFVDFIKNAFTVGGNAILKDDDEVLEEIETTDD